eukprot:CAMPEP_0197010694 /NCGR_PEP_ID=MMETSP1380-20130617/55439_1 /TAXON_ID=5936 /ORGANISM="Euplotes crassus, Strain CT5" /LENGTH=39 /DNA_ID= /DNA_START= /DNA_END= /DNA_ORIENTATION=
MNSSEKSLPDEGSNQPSGDEESSGQIPASQSKSEEVSSG